MPGIRGLQESERFMRHVSIGDACWTWTAYRMKSGYGCFRTRHGHELAHRAAFRLFKGALVDELYVMHSCDNPACVNPDHLSLGTAKDNSADAKAKGRTARGERHGRSKLTTEMVRVIRASRRPQKETAAAYGISQATVSDIVTGRKWAHLAPGDSHR